MPLKVKRLQTPYGTLQDCMLLTCQFTIGRPSAMWTDASTDPALAPATRECKGFSFLLDITKATKLNQNSIGVSRGKRSCTTQVEMTKSGNTTVRAGRNRSMTTKTHIKRDQPWRETEWEHTSHVPSGFFRRLTPKVLPATVFIEYTQHTSYARNFLQCYSRILASH